MTNLAFLAGRYGLRLRTDSREMDLSRSPLRRSIPAVPLDRFRPVVNRTHVDLFLWHGAKCSQKRPLKLQRIGRLTDALFVWLSVCLVVSFFACLFVCLHACVFVGLFVSVSTCMFFGLCVCVSVCVCVCLSVCLCLFACLLVCLLVCLCTCALVHLCTCACACSYGCVFD